MKRTLYLHPLLTTSRAGAESTRRAHYCRGGPNYAAIDASLSKQGLESASEDLCNGSSDLGFKVNFPPCHLAFGSQFF